MGTGVGGTTGVRGTLATVDASTVGADVGASVGASTVGAGGCAGVSGTTRRHHAFPVKSIGTRGIAAAGAEMRDDLGVDEGSWSHAVPTKGDLRANMVTGTKK